MTTPLEAQETIERLLRSAKLDKWVYYVMLHGSTQDHLDVVPPKSSDIDFLLFIKKDAPWYIKMFESKHIPDSAFNYNKSIIRFLFDTAINPKGILALNAYSFINATMTSIVSQELTTKALENGGLIAWVKTLSNTRAIDCFVVTEYPEVKDPPLQRKWRKRRKRIMAKTPGALRTSALGLVEIACRVGYKIEKRIAA